MEKVPRYRRPVALGDLQHLPDELLCRIVSLLAPNDVGSLACVSSIMYVFCNEEPLWMHLCLDNHEGLLEYKGSWKLTTLEKLGLVTNRTNAFDKAPLHFDGFTSLYLYRRWYRCHMALEAFIIPGVLERREKVTQEEFTALYDGKRPVLLTDLTEDWAAKDSWTIPHFVQNYGDVAFKVGQSHGKKVTMRFRDYAAYMTQQHDEDPLYIFDSKFGKHAPALLQDYQVPYLFQEDFLALLGDQRPAFRWLVIGPARSGASWHVDPGLTSAWNTLLCGRKRWALYPPGRVPPQVTVHVDEEDGDVNFDGPSSLQWWVDVYPSLKDEDKPIECIQYPGETIYVPSGWWHCVLNIDSSVAVTQNVVNSANLELVCLDMAPGFRHKGVARAGGMALGQAPFAPTYCAVANSVRTAEAALDGYSAQQRVGISVDDDHDEEEEVYKRGCSPLDATLLLAHTQEHPDHFTSTSGGNYLGQRVLRRWLRKLWADRTDLRPRIWNCACAVLDAETWVHRVICVCEAYGLPVPSGLERLPVGNGSNPVFVVGDKVIKFYVEEGPEGSVDVLGSELQFYAQVAENESPLLHAIPALVGSGILYPDGDKFRAVPWDGRGDIPRAHHASSSCRKRGRDSAAAQEESSEARVRTKWSRTGNLPDGAPGDAPQAGAQNSSNNSSNFLFWPYIVMERCSGRSLLSLLSEHASVDMLALASFLGQQVRNLHTLALPDTLSSLAGLDPPCVPEAEGSSQWAVQVPWEWHHFVSMLREKRQHITEQFDEWSTIPVHLVKQVETYLPTDPATAIDYLEVEGNVGKSVQPPVWIHTDIMVDNILMKEEAVEAATCGAHTDGDEDSIDASSGQGAAVVSGPGFHAEASHIIDFGDINFGDPLYDFIAVYLDVFQGDVELMKRFLHEYRLPFWAQPHSGGDRPRRLSYKAMCYVLLYRIRPGRVLMHMKERMQQAGSWEEVEQQVFGFLNHWQQQEQQQQQQM